MRSQHRRIEQVEKWTKLKRDLVKLQIKLSFISVFKAGRTENAQSQIRRLEPSGDSDWGFQAVLQLSRDENVHNVSVSVWMDEWGADVLWKYCPVTKYVHTAFFLKTSLSFRWTLRHKESSELKSEVLLGWNKLRFLFYIWVTDVSWDRPVLLLLICSGAHPVRYTYTLNFTLSVHFIRYSWSWSWCRKSSLHGG